MKKCVFLLLLMLTPLFGQHYLAQELQTGNKWYYIYTGRGHGSRVFAGYLLQEVVGDTLIDSLNFKIIKDTHYYIGWSDYYLYPYPPDWATIGIDTTTLRYVWSDSNIVIATYSMSNQNTGYKWETVTDTLMNMSMQEGDQLKQDSGFLQIKSKYFVSCNNQWFGDECCMSDLRSKTYISDMNHYVHYANLWEAKGCWLEKFGVIYNKEYSSDGNSTFNLAGAVINGEVYGDTSAYTYYIQAPTRIKDALDGTATYFDLQQNYPNPFNATTTLSWNLAAPGHVNITIYNTLGQRMATLVDGYQANTQGSIKWHGRDDHGNMVTSGIYFARLTTGDVVKTIKMAFVE